jgi:hypothetical protein
MEERKLSSDFIRYSPKRSEKAKTNAKWVSTDAYKDNYEEAMAGRLTYTRKPYCLKCSAPIVDGKLCPCGATTWVYR